MKLLITKSEDRHMVTRESIVEVAADVIFQELDGEAVLLNMQSEIYFGLDSMGTRIWQLLKEHGTLETVGRILMEEYDVAENELQRELLEFVDKLHSKGLVKVVQGSSEK